jgi:hypothetical protein
MGSSLSLDPNDPSSWHAKIITFGPTAMSAYDSYGNPYVYVPGPHAAQPVSYSGIPGYETGGPVPTTGPAIVHGGEYVVPKGGTLVSGGGGDIYVNVTGAFGTMDQVTAAVQKGIYAATGLKVSRSSR